MGLFFPALVRLQRQRGLLVCALQGVEALLLAGIVFVPFPLAMLFVISSGLLNGIALILFLSLIQARVERKMLGRMMSFLLLASFGLLPLSQAATGIVAQQAGIHVLFVSAGGVLLLGALIGLLVPSFRNLE
jgi:cyanate permease